MESQKFVILMLRRFAVYVVIIVLLFLLDVSADLLNSLFKIDDLLSVRFIDFSFGVFLFSGKLLFLFRKGVGDLYTAHREQSFLFWLEHTRVARKILGLMWMIFAVIPWVTRDLLWIAFFLGGFVFLVYDQALWAPEVRKTIKKLYSTEDEGKRLKEFVIEEQNKNSSPPEA